MTVPIQMTDLRLQYGSAVAVDRLNLEFPENSLTTLLGPSGCGKTTTLRAIAGLERLAAGRLEVSGRIVDEPAAKRFVPPEKRNIGMVFQNYGLWPHLTIEQNIGYPMKVQGVGRKERTRRVAELMGMTGLEKFAGRYPGTLSGGQQQRVAVARALARQPRVLLFDEPLSNLDARLRRSLRSQIRSVHEQFGTTTVFVTHDHEEALALSDFVAILLNGRLVQFGTPTEVYNRPATGEVADFLGFENILRVRVSDDPGWVLPEGMDTPLFVGEHTLARGSRATLALRRDHVHVVAPDDSRRSRMHGRVVNVAYFGSITEFSLQRGDLVLQASVDEWTLRRLGLELPRVGAELNVVLAEGIVPLMDEQSEPGTEVDSTEPVPHLA